MGCPAGYDSFVLLIYVPWEAVGLEPSNSAPFLSQLPFELHTVCICRFDLVAGMMILSNIGLCPKHTTQSDQRDVEKKRAVHLGHKTQSPNTLSVWTRISKSYTHQRGWEDWSHSNLEKARLCFTTVTLSQYYWGQPQWCCQPSHVYIICMYMQTCGHTCSVGFSFTNHQSRLINHTDTALYDPWCNLLITAVWVQLTDF